MEYEEIYSEERVTLNQAYCSPLDKEALLRLGKDEGYAVLIGRAKILGVVARLGDKWSYDALVKIDASSYLSRAGDGYATQAEAFEGLIDSQAKDILH